MMKHYNNHHNDNINNNDNRRHRQHSLTPPFTSPTSSTSSPSASSSTSSSLSSSQPKYEKSSSLLPSTETSLPIINHNQLQQQHQHQQRIIPSSLIANQSENLPTPECCCFSARFVNLILYLFNFILLLSGICILLLTVLYGRPEISRYIGERTKYLSNIIDLLGNGHLVRIIHYSMMFCGSLIIVISLLNICYSTATSWSKNSDYYYYNRHRRRCFNQNQLPPSSTATHENETLLRKKRQKLQKQKHLSSNTNEFDGDFESNMMTIDSRQQNSKNKRYSLPCQNTSVILDQKYSKNGSSKCQTIIGNYDCHQQQSQQYEQHSSVQHFTNSTIVLCFYIFILLFLFTIQLIIGLLSIITVSPDHVFISPSTSSSVLTSIKSSTNSIENDNFLQSVRESVNIYDLLVNNAEKIEPLYSEFHCCGWNYYYDYEYLNNYYADNYNGNIDNYDNNNYYNEMIIKNNRNKTIPVPDSCCKTFVRNCGHRKHPNNIYYDGCWSKFGNEMRDYVLMLGWTALGFAILELIALMFAVCHYVQIISKK